MIPAEVELKRIIRAKGGGTRKMDLTPIKAIRVFCLECVGHQTGAVRTCADELCPLWPYRMGTDPGREQAQRKGLVEPEEPAQAEEREEERAGQAGLFE